jgi:uncharacterized protein (DUF2336 family)
MISYDPDIEAERVRQGAHAGTPAAVLRSLAVDESVTVRASLALNPATPHDVHDMLARDDDVRVRAVLAAKLAALLPGLSKAEATRRHRQVYATLTHMVADTAGRVRAAIAETVKAMPEAPRELIVLLARDPEMSVAEPVIRLSPLLTSDDLMALLAEPPFAAAAQAVARRPDLTASVSDAIATGADTEAIRLLLTNTSAQIRETTLDALVARAAMHMQWHEPLVHHPALSAMAAHALCDIVAAQLIDVLVRRTDLDPKLAADLRARAVRRMEGAADAPADCSTARPAGGGGTAVLRAPPKETTASVEAAAHAAREQADAGTLTAEAVLRAAQRGETEAAAAILAIAAGVPRVAVHRATSLRSAKGIVSLAWQAGFSMADATALQPALLRPGPSDRFPLAVEEMRWQIEFLVKTAS